MDKNYLTSVLSRGGYVSSSDYYELLQEASYGVNKDFARNWFKTYYYNLDSGYYRNLTDPLSGVYSRDERKERGLGTLGYSLLR